MSQRLLIDGRFLTQAVTGVQRVGIEFCCALDNLLNDGEFPGVDVQVAVPRTSQLITTPRWKQIRVVRRGRLTGHLWEQLELPLMARGARLLSLGNTAPLGSLLFNQCGTYVMVHDLSYRYFPGAYGRKFRLFYEMVIPVVLKRAQLVFTVSESERSAILTEYPHLKDESRLIAVQNGGSPLVVGEVPTRSARDRRCLYVGSLTKRKNAGGLIAAAIRLVREHHATFTFVGSKGAVFGDIDIAIPEDVAHAIRFLGQIDDPERLADEYSRAAVFVFPSFYEASPLPPIEAMGHGCPVVASAIPSLQERCGDAAVFCDPHDLDSIVDAAASLLDSEALWNRLQCDGLSRCSRYSWRGQAQRIMTEVLRNGE